MMGVFGWVVAACIAGAWWWIARRDAENWRHLLRLLDELAEDRNDSGFVFRRGRWFQRLTHPLEKLKVEQARLRHKISEDAFNLHTILSSMEEGVGVVDARHVLRLVNPSLIRLFELKGDPLGETILGTFREAALEGMVREALQTGQAQAAEVALNGSKPPRHLAVHVVPVREQTGSPAVVMVLRDVSRLKQLEDVRREFVANVSHELRTPLSIFQGYLENLIDEPKMGRAEQAEIFAILRRHSQRLNALLQDLLAIARMESRREKLELRVQQLREIIETVAEDWTGKVSEKKLALGVAVDAALPPIAVERLRIEQVLNNLLENAVKYTGAGGRIDVRAFAEADAVVVRVEDTGAGIPPADLPHIFERFYRADKSRTREQGGTGLGLSIVKHIVQLHGGTVLAESTYGKGTAITLRLPLGA